LFNPGKAEILTGYGERSGRRLVETKTLSANDGCANAWPSATSSPVEEANTMSQDEAATLLRGYGFEVRTDGLGNVVARVYSKRSDGTVGFDWKRVPAGTSADVIRWIYTVC
jgi:hypothetical protein